METHNCLSNNGGNSSTHQDDEVEHISCDTGDWGSQSLMGIFRRKTCKTYGFRCKYVMLGKPPTHTETTTKLLERHQQQKTARKADLYTSYRKNHGEFLVDLETILLLMIQDDPAKTQLLHSRFWITGCRGKRLRHITPRTSRCLEDLKIFSGMAEGLNVWGVEGGFPITHITGRSNGFSKKHHLG